MPGTGDRKTPLLVVFLLLGVIIVIWGSTWLVIREANEYTDIFTGLWLRFLIASVVQGLLLLILRIRVPMDRNALMLYGLLTVCAFFLPYLLVYWAETYIESALTALLFSAFPIFVIVFAHFIVPSDRLTKIRVIGVLVSMGGLALLFVGKIIHPESKGAWKPANFTMTLGILAMLAAIGSSLVQAFQTVIVKLKGKNIHPMALIFLPMFFASCMFGVIALIMALTREPVKPNQWVWQAWTYILILAVLGSVVTFGTYFYLVQVLDVSKLSLNAFITPLFSLFVGLVFGNEAFSKIGYLGIPLAVGGVFLATRTWGEKKIQIAESKPLSSEIPADAAEVK
jgi:drug/metabolite transporter (DMT)-like permease